MKLRTRAVRLIVGLLAATLVAGSVGIASADEEAAEKKEGRRVDLEIGAGFLLGIEEDTTIDDTWYTTIDVAIELNDSIDLELGAGWGPGEDPDGVPADDNYDLYHFGGGFRWYPNSEPDDIVRFYLNAGVQAFNELKGDDTLPAGVRFGPGFRIRLGEQSGVLMKLPLWVSISGQTDTLLMPTLSWFYSF
jgi:hypothetical protein